MRTHRPSRPAASSSTSESSRGRALLNGHGLASTPSAWSTRAIFAVGVALTAGTGLALFLLPGRTEDYWAWPIAAEPTTGFIGAGFLGAVVSLGLAALEPAWQHSRLIAVLAFTLTSLALLVTVLHLDPFALDAGGLVGAVAWTWLVVYIALPPLVLVAFVRQERAGGRVEYGGRPALAVTRVVAACVGIALAGFGVALLAGWESAASSWPWPLTPLTAGIVGVWLATYAVGLLWFACRDPSWRRSRSGVIALAVTLVLELAGTARLWDDFDGGAASVVYVVALLALLAGVGAAALAESRRSPGLELS